MRNRLTSLVVLGGPIALLAFAIYLAASERWSLAAVAAAGAVFAVTGYVIRRRRVRPGSRRY